MAKYIPTFLMLVVTATYADGIQSDDLKLFRTGDFSKESVVALQKIIEKDLSKYEMLIEKSKTELPFRVRIAALKGLEYNPKASFQYICNQALQLLKISIENKEDSTDPYHGTLLLLRYIVRYSTENTPSHEDKAFAVQYVLSKDEKPIFADAFFKEIEFCPHPSVWKDTMIEASNNHAQNSKNQKNFREIVEKI